MRFARLFISGLLALSVGTLPVLAQDQTLHQLAQEAPAADPLAFSQDVTAHVMRLLQDAPRELQVFPKDSPRVHSDILRQFQPTIDEDDLSAIPALAEAFAHSEPGIQTSILRLLKFLSLPAEQAGNDTRQAIIQTTAEAAMGSSHSGIRVQALDLLDRIGGPATLDLARKGLQDAAWQVRYKSIHVLTQFTDDHPELYDEVLPLAETDPSDEVRLMAEGFMMTAILP